MNEDVLVKWIRKNVNINHDEMMYDEAEAWFELMESDFLKFVQLGLLGYAWRLDPEGAYTLDETEVTAFIKEFQYKIILAFSGDVRVPGLPLFGIAEIGLVGEHLVAEETAYRIQPPAKA